MEGLQVGILLNGETVQKWIHQSINRLVSETKVEITHVVINNEEQRARGVRENISKAIDIGPWAGIAGVHKMCRSLGLTNKYYRQFKQQVSVMENTYLQEADILYCEPLAADGFGKKIPAEIVKRIRNTCDIVLRFGFGILKGDILKAPEYGVLSFHHGDLREYRGQPPGLWEFLNNEQTAGVTLQRISETLDGGEIIAYRDVDIDNAQTWQEVQYELYNISPKVLVDGIKNICDPDFTPRDPESLGKLYTHPDLESTIQYILKNMSGKLQ